MNNVILCRFEQFRVKSSLNVSTELVSSDETRMWANAQRDGRPAEYRWRLLFNATNFG